MGLSCQIIDLIRLNNADDPDQAGRVGQIAVVELDLVLDMVDAGSIGNGCPAGNAVNFIALLQQKLCQIGTILTGNTGDKCFFHISTSTFSSFITF